MIIEAVTQYFAERGLTPLRGNEEGFLANYIHRDQEVYILIHFYMPEGNEFTTSRIWQVHQHVTSHFYLKGVTDVHVLHIFYTRHPELLHHICPEGEAFWLMDMNINRLILFEDQPADFIGIREDLENFILGGYTRPYSGNFQQSASGNVKRNSIGICNTILVAVNILVFLVVSLLSQYAQNMITWYGALYGPAIIDNHEYYRLITYMFLHGGMEHLFNNMLVLVFIGNQMELMLGKWKYLILYFASGIIAGTVSIVYNMIGNTDVLSIGASGAIFGVIGAMLGILIINKGRTEDVTVRRLLLFIVLSIYSGVTSQGIDNAAHVGGLLAGVILAVILYRRHRRQRTEGES